MPQVLDASQPQPPIEDPRQTLIERTIQKLESWGTLDETQRYWNLQMAEQLKKHPNAWKVVTTRTQSQPGDYHDILLAKAPFRGNAALVMTRFGFVAVTCNVPDIPVPLLEMISTGDSATIDLFAKHAVDHDHEQPGASYSPYDPGPARVDLDIVGLEYRSEVGSTQNPFEMIPLHVDDPQTLNDIKITRIASESVLDQNTAAPDPSKPANLAELI